MSDGTRTNPETCVRYGGPCIGDPCSECGGATKRARTPSGKTDAERAWEWLAANDRKPEDLDDEYVLHAPTARQSLEVFVAEVRADERLRMGQPSPPCAHPATQWESIYTDTADLGEWCRVCGALDLGPSGWRLPTNRTEQPHLRELAAKAVAAQEARKDEDVEAWAKKLAASVPAGDEGTRQRTSDATLRCSTCGVDSDDTIALIPRGEGYECEECARRRTAKETSAYPPPLCSRGCCRECDVCAAKPGSPTLCADCLTRRRDCNQRWARHADDGRRMADVSFTREQIEHEIAVREGKILRCRFENGYDEGDVRDELLEELEQVRYAFGIRKRTPHPKTEEK